MNHTRGLFILVLLAGAAAACNRPPEDEQTRAMEAQDEANQKLQEANHEAAEKTAEVRKDMNEKTAEPRKEHDQVADGNQKVQEARADTRETAANARGDATREVVAADESLRTWGQEKIDGLNTKIDGARAKSEKSKPKQRAEFEAGMKDVQAKRDVLVTEFARLGTNKADDRDKRWSPDPKNEAAVDQFKSRMDGEIIRLTEHVDRLERRL